MMALINSSRISFDETDVTVQLAILVELVERAKTDNENDRNRKALRPMHLYRL